jgi:hypothetical protein
MVKWFHWRYTFKRFFSQSFTTVLKKCSPLYSRWSSMNFFLKPCCLPFIFAGWRPSMLFDENGDCEFPYRLNYSLFCLFFNRVYCYWILDLLIHWILSKLTLCGRWNPFFCIQNSIPKHFVLWWAHSLLSHIPSIRFSIIRKKKL